MPSLSIVGNPSIYLREEDAGLLLGGVYECRPREALVGVDPPDRLDQLPPDGALELRRAAAGLAATVPLLGRSWDFSVAHGAPCHTPDQRAIVGHIPGADGLFVITGDNYGGVTRGPGLAHALADEIAGRESTLLQAPNPFRLDRFSGTRYDVASLARDPALRAMART